MIAKLNEPKRNYCCDAHYRALAYLVRFSPEDARPLLQREIATDEAGCGGGEAFCNGSLRRQPAPY